MEGVDVRAALPVGSVLRRKALVGDEWDFLRVVSHAQFVLEGGGTDTEPVVVPAFEHASPIHVALEALDEHYLLVDEGAWPPPPWETPALDALLRRDSSITDRGGVTRVIADERDTERGEPSERVKKWKEQNDPDPLTERLNQLEESA